MEYRVIPRTGTRISAIGFGGTHYHEITQAGLAAMFNAGIDAGINLVDFAMSYGEPFDVLGPLLETHRPNLVYQLHLGMIFPESQYDRTWDGDTIRGNFSDQLSRLRTDYTDIAFFHCVDTEDDFEAIFRNGVYDFAIDMKKQGVIRNLGFASHTIDICERFLDVDGMDVCMFSINPAYDFDPENNIPFEGVEIAPGQARAVSRRRYAFYDECVRRRIGIQVMKAYAGGLLLDENSSPLGCALTVPQCLQYALERPGVLSCLVGASSLAQLEAALKLCSTPEEELDYSFIAGLAYKDMKGACVYCNHCLPCPADIDIAAVNKYFDLATAGDELAKRHYMELPRKAVDCIQCGRCEQHCPFAVPVRERMKTAAEILG